MDEEYLAGVISDAIRDMGEKLSDVIASESSHVIPLLATISTGGGDARCVAFRVRWYQGEGYSYDYILMNGETVEAIDVRHIRPLPIDTNVLGD